MNQSLYRIQLLKKLWVHLTPNETFGLCSPDRIQRSGQNLGDVRRKELSHLLTIERQLHELRRGHSALDSDGKLIRCAEIQDIRGIKFSSIIENTDQVEVETEALPDIASMLENAEALNRLDGLERLLRLQKLYLLSERMILGMTLSEVDKEPLDRRWLSRWKLNACESSNGALQQLWARILVGELVSPGSTSLWTLGYLANCSLMDAENLSHLASWLCGDFIYRSALRATSGALDSGTMLKRLEEQSIIKGVSGKVLTKTLLSDTEGEFSYQMVLADKLLLIDSHQARPELNIPAYMVTSVGCALLGLVPVAADPAYLELITQDLQARGMNVRVVHKGSDEAIADLG